MQESDTKAIRILLIDGLELFIDGLRALIQSEPGMIVVGTAQDLLVQQRVCCRVWRPRIFCQGRL